MYHFKKIEAGLYRAEVAGRVFELARDPAGFRNRSWTLWERTEGLGDPKNRPGRLVNTTIKHIKDGEQVLTFVLALNEKIQAMGATEEGPYQWTLNTSCGPLYIRCSGRRSVYMRFAEIADAAAKLQDTIDFNRYSGKWNMHMDDTLDLETAIHQVESRLTFIM